MRGPVTALPRGPDFHSVALVGPKDLVIKERSHSAHAIPWLLTRHSTTPMGVLRSKSACSKLMSDDLRLPRRIKPQPSGFREIG